MKRFGARLSESGLLQRRMAASAAVLFFEFGSSTPRSGRAPVFAKTFRKALARFLKSRFVFRRDWRTKPVALTPGAEQETDQPESPNPAVAGCISILACSNANTPSPAWPDSRTGTTARTRREPLAIAKDIQNSVVLVHRRLTPRLCLSL
jgi:hypothetical protein